MMHAVHPDRRPRRCNPGWPGFRCEAGVAAIAFAFALAGSGAATAQPVQDAPLSSLDQLKAWVLTTGDNHGRPFVIVDKLGAQATAFDQSGALAGSAPVLLGVAESDDSPPGIGDRPLADIGPEDRVTPAGRFAAELGENLAGKSVLWVDYDAAVSLHPVVTGRPSERRQARLDSATPSDNRISYGCINVPAAFYRTVVQPLFTNRPGIVYVIPETRSLKQEFFDHPSPERLALN